MTDPFQPVLEAAFHPVQGGYIFEVRGKGLSGVPRAYRVTEAQKAELIALQLANGRRWKPLSAILSCGILVLVVGSAASFYFLSWIAAALCLVCAVALPFAAFAVMRFFNTRAVEPLLSTLPLVAEPIGRHTFERKAETARRVMEWMAPATETQPGSWVEGWTDTGTGTSGLAQTVVKTAIRLDTRIESRLARGTYWVGTVIGLALSSFSIWLLLHDNYSRDDLMAVPLVIAAALLIYFAGWGWRWLWTGRTDHLFAEKKYTPPGGLDEARKNACSLVALSNF